MTKQEKVKLINEALQKSSTAQEAQAVAEVLPNGRIEYRKLSGNGRYMMKASFREMLALMWGADMRALKGQFGR